MKPIRTIFALAVALAAVRLWAVTTGTISTSGSDCSVSTNCVVANLGPGSGGVVITITGSFTGTLQFEAAGDGVTYTSISVTPPNSTTTVTSTAAAGTWQVNTAGYTNFRVRASALSGGTPTVSISFSTASARSNSGSSTGSGTVNAGTAGQWAYYATSGTAVSGIAAPAVAPTFVTTMVSQSGTEGQQVVLVPSYTAVPSGLFIYHSGKWIFSGGPTVTPSSTAISIIANPSATVYEVDWDVISGVGLAVTGVGLVTLNFPTLNRIDFNADLGVADNASLTTITIPNLTAMEANNTIDFSSNALSVATVNAILHQATFITAGTGPTLSLESQTPAAIPTGQGTVDYRTLTAAGWAVTTDQYSIAPTACNVAAHTFTFAGNQTQYFVATSDFQINGSTSDDGTYTVVSSTFTSSTSVVVSQAIPICPQVSWGLAQGPF